FYTILRENGASTGRDWPQPTGTAFVIASPEARAVLDRTCIAGLNQWRDVWWAEAAQTGILEIGNHSWDHTHPTLDSVAQRDQRNLILSIAFRAFMAQDNLSLLSRLFRKRNEPALSPDDSGRAVSTLPTAVTDAPRPAATESTADAVEKPSYVAASSIDDIIRVEEVSDAEFFIGD